MPQLYIKEYSKNLAGRRVCIACREGILRDNFTEIVADIKFLARHEIKTNLFHNLPNRLANQNLLRELQKKLVDTRLIRVEPDVDFYDVVVNHPDVSFKLIFIERRYLIDPSGNKINTLTTGRVRESMTEFGDLIANVNFKVVLNHLCEKIESGHCERIHILPAGKNTIKHELFTVEGTGTMIADNFVEEFRQVQTDDEVAIVYRILSMYRRGGFLKPRSKQYLSRNRHSFFVISIDGIAVGCVEQKIVDDQTVELGALAISTRFRSQRVGVYAVDAFMKTMTGQGYTHFISLTNNPRLQALFQQIGFRQESLAQYTHRQNESPDVPMFHYPVES